MYRSILFLLAVLLTSLLSFAQQAIEPLASNDFYIRSYTVKNGLAQNDVTSITRDNYGFMWFGTRGGFSRFDGYEFVNFKPLPECSNCIKNPSIESIFKDSRNNIWIGTSSSLHIYDLKFEKFTKISLHDADNTQINKIYEDKQKRIWICTWDKGLLLYKHNNQALKQYLENENVRDVVESKDGTLWVVSYNGLWRYNAVKDTFTECFSQQKKIQYQGFVTACTDPDGQHIWVSGWGQGVFKFNIKTNQYEQLFARQPKQILYNCYKLFFDSKGSLWIGTWGQGLWNLNAQNNALYRVNLGNKIIDNSARYNSINEICEDSAQNIWIGTGGKGVVLLTRKQGFTKIKILKNESSQNEEPYVNAVIKDEKGNLFVGTMDGLFWSKNNTDFQAVQNNNGKIIKTIQRLFRLRDGKIWVGSLEYLSEIVWKNGKPVLYQCDELYKNNELLIWKALSFAESDDHIFVGSHHNSLYLLKKNKDGSKKLIKQFIPKRGASGFLQNERISALLLDKKKRLWIGTHNGLHYLENDKIKIVDQSCIKNNKALTCNIITCLKEDKNGNIWVGTPCGIHKFSDAGYNTFVLKTYNTSNGLTDDYIHSIIESKNGDLWVSTNISISKLDIKDDFFRNFYESDGISVFNFGPAGFLAADGEIYFGGSGGATRFYPEQIKENSQVPQIVFSSFKILNTKIGVNDFFQDRQILDSSINEQKKIRLTHLENEITFEIAALDFHYPERNQYAFKLENYSKDWEYIGTRKWITFSNLPAGVYTLRVKGSNNNNIWNQADRKITIEVLAPLWKRWYAYLFYGLMLVTIIFTILQAAVTKVKLEKNLEMVRLKNEQEHQINELKIQYFTNISHEFRTPLTLIIAPLKELLLKAEQYGISGEVSSKVSNVLKNAQRIMKLINQLLDLRKIENEKVKLETVNADIVEFVQEIGTSYKDLAKINKINFAIEPQISSAIVTFDMDKTEVIITNLLSNAFKFVPENGKIKLQISEDEMYVKIHVIDNGPGIAECDQKNVFEYFYQIKPDDNYGSSGIGLSLVKQFVELHHGKIELNSKAFEKTEFIVSFPKATTSAGLQSNLKHPITSPNIEKTNIQQVIKPNIVKSEKKILVVDDNEEIRNYLSDLLSAYHFIFTAIDGEDALIKLDETLPDLIISDVVMPNVDGFELCKILKNDPRFTDIPVILLTAKSKVQNEIISIRAGADDFISKPFEPELLIEKIENLLQTREKLKSMYSKKVKIESTNVEITPITEKLIEQAIKTIENNLTNPEFNAEYLAEKLNTSYSSLYRKIKQATGYSISEFIRKIKLERAAKLLKDKDKTISQIAFEVGFNDIKYFRECFQKLFKQTPSDYRKSL
jgi:signal transduction histidine kinase/ligand-binding sensor domain-containing protein/DNA-binding response OmpR family regulator